MMQKLLSTYAAFSALVVMVSGASLRTNRHGSSHVSLVKQNQSARHLLGKRTEQHQLIFDVGELDECGVTKQTTAQMINQRGKNCPGNCPLYVQDKTDELFCSFRCVAATASTCKAMNPAKPVPDTNRGVCRSCEVTGCHTCNTDGTDTCLLCKSGQTLSGGLCYNNSRFVQWGIIVFVVLVVSFISTWLWSLRKRADLVANDEGLIRALEARSASKLHKPAEIKEGEEGDDVRDFYEMSTNLTKTPVAGAGVLHLFSFQALLIGWAVFVALTWTILVYSVDTDLFRLGTRSPGKTPRDNCIIIAWGFETQHRLMPWKVLFVVIVYVVSFVGAILYAIRQLRFHEQIDETRISHKDYCAELHGLPTIKGDVHIEHELKVHLREVFGTNVIGVSVCFDFGEKEDTLMKVIAADMEERENEGKVEDMASKHEENHTFLHSDKVNRFDRACSKFEAALMSPEVQKIVKKSHASAAMTKCAMRNHGAEKKNVSDQIHHDEEVEEIEVDITSELENLYTTEEAFVVFETEADRDRCIQESEAMGGIDFRGVKLSFTPTDCEPQGVNWSKIQNRTWLQHTMRCVAGFCCILLALAVWCFCFYLPYAQSVARTDYAHGKDPNPLAKTMFGLIVVAGNAMMYIVCAEVSDRVGFKTQSKREICYMLLYTFACVFNVALDLVAAYFTAYKMMVGMGMKTHDGEGLAEVDTIAEVFQTYAMQKSLGQILFDYAFPSTFLIPFLAEPFAVISMPFEIMSLIIRSNSAIVGPAAEAYLASTPMDLSRYADVMLNLLLAVLMMFFPGGFLLKIMCGMILAHLWIYAYDHYRVLRSIPACDMATNDVDWWAQWMLSIPCGLLIACASFKSNCEEDALHCWRKAEVAYWCLGFFFGHILIHTLLLLHFVPKFSRESKPNEDPYKKCATMHPCSWFNANPCFCLRSVYIYNHKHPCDYFVLGKDHLLRPSEELHCHYHAHGKAKEHFGIRSMLQEAKSNLKQNVTVLEDNLTKSMSLTGIKEEDNEEEKQDKGKGK